MQTNSANYMGAYKPFSKHLLLLAFAAVIVAGSWTLFDGNRLVSRGELEANYRESPALFSPDDDLEGPDIRLLNSAKYSLDVAMYAFTDEEIESALVAAAKRGVKIRIYRDALQLADEQARASQKGRPSTTDLLRTVPGIEIRVKARGKSMHLKSYCVDRELLRTGSANWSPDGELAQDNDLYLVSNPSTVQKFESDFEKMWERSSNTRP